MSRRRAFLALAVAGALALTACGQRANENPSTAQSSGGTEAPATGGKVVFSNIAETTTLDPAIAFSSDGFEFVRNVYEGLTSTNLVVSRSSRRSPTAGPSATTA